MKEILTDYLQRNRLQRFDLKAVIFDMDGVLYDSMPAHDRSWQQTMDELGLTHEPNEFYLHEGRIGKATIDIIFQRNLKRDAAEEEEKRIYARKSELFQEYNSGATIPGAKEVLTFVREEGLIPVLVTGSGQPSLLERLDHHFAGCFTPKTMVTAFDVVNGKPDPEPFVKGLQKGGGLQPHQAIVIENAPLGIEAAVGAGIFTIAVNTGPLPDIILREAGASLVFDSMHQLAEVLPEIIRLAGEVTA
ncbi:HAD hydrolase-like protein [Dysgonomonadaceae bacterium zrk40]|nr:HAD hydrolase-like protein [Dysgonomonadaceae bacterium zrk40]